VHLVGVITKKFVTMRGHMNVGRKKCVPTFSMILSYWHASSHSFSQRLLTDFNKDHLTARGY